MLPIEAAAIWSILGAYLLLPANMTVEVPLMPPLDRMNIAAISTFLLCWMKGSQTPSRPPSILMYLFSMALIISPILTSLDNSYELPTAAGSIPGMYPLDGAKIAFRQAMALLPFFVGMRFLSSERGRELLLKSLPTAFLFYSLPMLIEMRVSPQFHRWVYGYHPADFIQEVRAGGFRPVVFVGHGLEVAFLTSLAVIAALVLIRTRSRIYRFSARIVAPYLAVLLLLCKSLGPFIYAVFLAPIVLFTRPRTWVKLACAAILVVSVYPLLRTHDLIPVDHISRLASSVSTDRSASLDTRIYNEHILLDRANKKPLWGWGTWGRNRVYDKTTGKDVSITDGEWIIQYGMYGWFGYLALFGLIGATALRALGAIGREITPASLTLGGLTLMIGVYVIDFIPNANPLSLIFLVAGSVAGAATIKSRRPKPHRRAVNVSRTPVVA